MRPLEPPVARLVDGVLAAAEPLHPVRIVLLGSTARHEHSYGVLAGHEELYGDLEVLVMVNRPLEAGAERRFHAEVQAVERRAGYQNPFFHIDAPVRDDRLFWLRFPHEVRLASLELVRSGQVLEGAPLPRDHPAAVLDRLDRGALREVALTRLWLHYRHLPIQVLEGSECAWERQILGLASCRNLLDILTVLLPEQGVLHADYRSRLARAEADPALLAPLGPGALAMQREALRGKLELRVPEDPVPLYRAFLDQSARLLLHLLADPARPEADLDTAIRQAVDALVSAPRDFARPSAVLRARRLPALARAALSVARHGGVAMAARFAAANRRNRMAATLLLLHRDVVRQLEGEPPRHVAECNGLLQGLGGHRPLPDAPAERYKAAMFVLARARQGAASPSGAETWRHPHAAAPPRPR